MGTRDIFTAARERVLARKGPLLGVVLSGALVLAVLLLALLPLGIRDVAATALEQQSTLSAEVPASSVDEVFGVPDGAVPATVEPPAPILLVGMLVVLLVALLWASTAFAAAVRAYACEEGVFEAYRRAFGTVVYQSSQSSFAMAPLLLVGALIPLAPVGAQLALLVVVVLASLPLALIAALAVVATSLGERAHVPRSAVAAIRARPQVAVSVFAVLVVVSVACAALGVIPVLGQALLVVVSTWSVGVLVELHAALTGDVVEPVAEPEAAVARARQAVAVAPAPGPLLEGVVVAQTGAGEWLIVDAPGTVTLQLAWSEGPPVLVQVADAAGAWLQVAQPASNGGPTAFHAAAPGQYWIALAAQGPQPQSYRVATWLPARVPAA